MPASSLLALIDDIATVLDDVALLSKVAAKKTTGVLGDDLALNAQQVVGVAAERELPIVFSVAKGSMINKVILVPSALLISSFASFMITPLLIAGGSFLCFEGFEKVFEKLVHNNKTETVEETPLQNPAHISAEQLEKEKIKGAVRTDFILSAEIIVIALGSVAHAPFITQLLTLSLVAIVMTIGVYGLVAVIVKLDDMGLYLGTKKGDFFAAEAIRRLGHFLLRLAPTLMKGLGIAGTIAMFLVGGGIVNHGIPNLHHFQEQLNSLGAILFDAAMGILLGAAIFAITELIHRIKPNKNTTT